MIIFTKYEKFTVFLVFFINDIYKSFPQTYISLLVWNRDY